MSLFKNLFGKKEEDVPEIHLQKNEPKVVYDPIKKRYIFGDEPVEDEKPKGPPPKVSISSKGKNTKKLSSSSRYANAFGEENIITTSEPVKTPPKEKEEKIEEKIEQKVEENPVNNKEEDKKEENIISSSPNEKEHRMDEQKNDDIISEIEHKEEEASTFLNNEINNFQNPMPTNGMMIANDVHEAEIEKIKNEYNEKITKVQNQYLEEINELKETNQFERDNYEENSKLLKDQINKFINENLTLKVTNEKNEDEIKNKIKEIEGLNKIIEHYRSYIDDNKKETEVDNTDTPGGEKVGGDFVLINSRLEKLESEKLILSNDLIELKGENESVKIENKYLQSKASQFESQNEKLKKEVAKLEKKINEQNVDFKTLINKKDDLEFQLKNKNSNLQTINNTVKQQKNEILNLNKTTKSLKDKISELTSQIKTTQDNNDELQETIRKNQLNSDKLLNSKQNQIDEINQKFSNFKKQKGIQMAMIIKEKDSLKAQINDLLRENEYKVGMEKVLNETVKGYNELKEKNFYLENKLENYSNNFKRIILFLSKNKNNFNEEIQNIISNNLEEGRNFDKIICQLFLELISSLSTTQNTLSIFEDKNKSLSNEISHLQNEIIMNAAKIKFINSDFESEKKRNVKKYNDIIQQLKNENSKLKVEIGYTSKLKAENIELNNKIRELMDMLTTTKNDYEEELKESSKNYQEKFNAIEEKFNESKKQYEKEIEESNKNYQNIQEKLSSLEKVYEEAKINHKEELEKSNNNLTEIQNKLSFHEQEKNSLTNELSSSKQLNIQLNEKIQELMSILTTLQAETDKINEENENSSQQFNEIIQEKNNVIESYEKEKKDLNGKIDEFEKEKAKLIEELEQLKNNYTIVNEGLKQSQIKIDQLLSEKNIQNENNNQIINALQSEKNDYEHKIKEMMELLQQTEKDMVDDETNTEGTFEVPKQVNILEKKEIQKVEAIPNTIEKKESSSSEEVKIQNEDKKQANKDKQDQMNNNSQEQQPKQGLGFFGRLLAPIFLTENELEKIQGNQVEI